MRHIIFLLSVLTICSVQAQTPLQNTNFEKELSSWTPSKEHPKAISIDRKGGIDQSTCLKISLSDKGVAECTQKFTNLTVGKTYVVRGWVKGENIESRGNIGANFGITGSWDISEEGLKGSFDWRQMTMTFLAQKSTESFSMRLGHWYNESCGTAWFDSFSIEPLDMFVMESPAKHIRMHLPATFVKKDQEASIAKWLGNLDKTYEAYVEFIGQAPYNGATIDIVGTLHLLPGAWAWAGNPISWTGHYVESELKSLEEGNWSFGIMHEIAHDFAINSDSYNWNEEMFANLRMYYALEKLNGTVHQGGRVRNYMELKEYYRTQGTKFNADNLMYYLLTIKDEIGWEPFKKTIRELGELPDTKRSDYEKYTIFVSTLAKHANIKADNLLSQVAQQKIYNMFNN